MRRASRWEARWARVVSGAMRTSPGRTRVGRALPARVVLLGGERNLARGAERLVEIGDDVVDMLDADRQPDIIVRDAGRQLLLCGQLGVRGRGRVNREAARIADIGDVVEQLQRVDEVPAGGLAALQLEADQAAEPALQIRLGAPRQFAGLLARVD